MVCFCFCFFADPILKEKILAYLSSSSENVENELIGSMDESSLTNGNGVLYHRQSSCTSTSSSRTRRKKDPIVHSHSAPLQDITSSRKYDNEPAGGSTSTAQPTFEAFVMTGERVLKLTKNTSLGPKHQKKIDSLKGQNCRTGKNACSSTNQNYKFKSTPSSPVESDNSTDMKSSSANTSPVSLSSPLQSTQSERNSPFLANMSKSDDDIQYKKDVSLSTNSVQVDDDDLTSSLHTLLDTRSDSKTDDKRVLWTYNASRRGPGASSSTIASSENISSQHSISPPSPTSVSSSVMSSMSSSTDRKRPQNNSSNNNSIDLSQMEGLSNISSPDYQEETSDMLNSNDIGMEVTDPSDSDSTLLVSEPKIRRLNKCVGSDGHELNGGIASKYMAGNEKSQNHRVVIQVGISRAIRAFRRP